GGRVHRPPLFSQVGQVLLGPGLFLGVAPQVAVGGSVQPNADLGAEALHGTAGGLQAACLAEVVGEFLVGPVGPVEPLLGRPVDGPGAQVVSQGGRDMAGLAGGLLGLQSNEAAVAVSVEPTGNGLAMYAEVGGDVLAGPTALGHQDDLETIPQFPVVGGAEGRFQAFGLSRRQVNADHGGVPSECGCGCIRLDDGTPSTGSCIRPTLSRAASARASAAPRGTRAISNGTATFSVAVRAGNRLYCW